jgi:ankyrin repeat protein
MNAIQKRHKQKLDWRDSDTNKAPALIRNAKKIGFDDGVKFLAACRNVDIDEMEAILSRGIDIDVSNSDGLTALHRVCYFCDAIFFQFF